MQFVNTPIHTLCLAFSLTLSIMSTSCFLFESYELEERPPKDGGNDSTSDSTASVNNDAFVQQPISCSQDHWCMYSSVSDTENLLSIWGSGPNDVWAVGSKGLVVHWNGQIWKTETIGTTNDLYGVWGSGPNDVWLVGDKATIIRWNGNEWAAVRLSGATEQLGGVWGTGPKDVWVVGRGGKIFRWNGTLWTTYTSYTPNDLYNIWGLDANNAWAVGYNGTILYWNGNTWANQTSGLMNWVYNVWGSDPNNIWAAGWFGVLRYNMGAWTAESLPLPSGFYGLGGIDATNAWVVGPADKVYYWNGVSWVIEATTNTGDKYLRSIWASSAKDVWAVGQRGTILRRLLK